MLQGTFDNRFVWLWFQLVQKLDQKKLYNAGTFQIVGSALNICPESIPKNIKNDYEKRLKQIVKENKK